MIPELFIRRLTHGDVDEYIRLRQEGVQLDPVSFGRTYATEHLVPRALYVAFLAPSRRRVIWGAFWGTRLVGMVRLQSDGRSFRRTVYSLYVSPEVRNRGIAQRLLGTALRKARREPQVRMICLNVETSNKVALNMYRSKGFRECSVTRDAYRVGNHSYSEFSMRKFIRSSRGATPLHSEWRRPLKARA